MKYNSSMKLTSYPDLVKVWHSTKNGELTPNDYTYGSDKKVWWLCPNSHSYNTAICDRVQVKLKCPYCSGKKTLNHDLFN